MLVPDTCRCTQEFLHVVRAGGMAAAPPPKPGSVGRQDSVAPTCLRAKGLLVQLQTQGQPQAALLEVRSQGVGASQTQHYSYIPEEKSVFLIAKNFRCQQNNQL